MHVTDVIVVLDQLGLPGQVTVPDDPRGVVVFAHGSGSSRLSPRNQAVARTLNEARLATLLFDLLTDAEALDRENVFDIPLLAGRLAGATAWLRDHPAGLPAALSDGLPVGLFGASTGAAAALWAASQPDADIGAVVSRGGRPDLAGVVLGQVRAPTLLLVGGLDREVLRLNRYALGRLRCPAQLIVVPGATHLFEEPGTLQVAAECARDWFLAHLAGIRQA